jgi:hypothetical protein
MKPNRLSILAMATMLASFDQTSREDFGIMQQNEHPEKPKEPIIPKGQFHYWFRADGTFLNEKQSERMLKEECVFKCFALNDKNAIKKFNTFISKNHK